MSVLLSVEDLRTSFHTHGGVIQAVDGVDFSIEKGGALAGVRSVVTLVPSERLGVVVLANLNVTLLPEVVRARVLEGYLGPAGRDLQVEFGRQRAGLAQRRCREPGVKHGPLVGEGEQAVAPGGARHALQPTGARLPDRAPPGAAAEGAAPVTRVAVCRPRHPRSTSPPTSRPSPLPCATWSQ